MKLGKVKWFDAKKGYGFVSLVEDKQDAFIHITLLQRKEIENLFPNQLISCEIKDNKGKLMVEDFSLIKEGING
jgi:CspA family cold shock protein